MRTWVYIDGFNLYHRALKKRPHFRWLDLLTLCQVVLTTPYQVDRVFYYTARVKDLKPGQQSRQDLYLRALATTPEVQGIYGYFRGPHPKNMPLAQPPAQGPKTIEVLKVEEKRSDVNLASHLVRDACKRRFDAAAVITCDGDLVEPIRIAREEGFCVALLNPDQKNPLNKKLAQAASFRVDIKNSHLKKAQFPDPLTTKGHILQRPPSWV